MILAVLLYTILFLIVEAFADTAELDRPLNNLVKHPIEVQPTNAVEIREYEFQLKYPVTTEEVLHKELMKNLQEDNHEVPQPLGDDQ